MYFGATMQHDMYWSFYVLMDPFGFLTLDAVLGL